MPKFKFGDIAINCTEKRKPTEADMATYIGLEHLDSGSLTVHRFGSAVPIKGDKTIMHKGDILFGKRNAYLKRAAIAPHDGLFSAHGMVLRPKENVVDKDFFPHFINSDYFFDEAIRISVGSLSPTINWSALKELEFELPSLEKQRSLARILWAINRTSEAYKVLLARTDDLVKSQFCEMIEGHSYPDFPLISLIMDGAGLSYGIVQPGDDGTGDMGVLRPVDLVYGGISTSQIKYVDRTIGNGYKRTELTGKEILITVRGTTGITAITDERFAGMNVSRGIAVIRYNSNKINPIYLNTILNSPKCQSYIQEHTQGIALRQINMADLRTLPITLPPFAIQDELAAFVTQLDKSKFCVPKDRKF